MFHHVSISTPGKRIGQGTQKVEGGAAVGGAFVKRAIPIVSLFQEEQRPPPGQVQRPGIPIFIQDVGGSKDEGQEPQAVHPDAGHVVFGPLSFRVGRIVEEIVDEGEEVGPELQDLLC